MGSCIREEVAVGSPGLGLGCRIGDRYWNACTLGLMVGLQRELADAPSGPRPPLGRHSRFSRSRQLRPRRRRSWRMDISGGPVFSSEERYLPNPVRPPLRSNRTRWGEHHAAGRPSAPDAFSPYWVRPRSSEGRRRRQPRVHRPHRSAYVPHAHRAWSMGAVQTWAEPWSSPGQAGDITRAHRITAIQDHPPEIRRSRAVVTGASWSDLRNKTPPCRLADRVRRIEWPRLPAVT